jgi:hypothetical protein
MIVSQLSGQLDPGFNPFQDDYVAEILNAAATAWSRMRAPKLNEIEDRITFRLAGRLANDALFSELPYDVVPQFWLLGLDGQRLGRLDLRFKHRCSQKDYFAFESKRLHVRYPKGGFSTEYPTYAGEDGMMAFIQQQYCKGFPSAGMLGYVMDGRSSTAWAGLEKRIDAKRSPLKLSQTSSLAQSLLSGKVLGGIQGAYLGETDHNLTTHSLRIYHLILPVKKAKKKS